VKASVMRFIASRTRAAFAASDPRRTFERMIAASFERSSLDWTEAGDEPRATVLRWHRELIALRAANPALRDGDRSAMVIEHDEESRTLVVRRAGVTVACNWGEAAVSVRVADGGVAHLLSDGAVAGGGGVQLEPDSVAILVARDVVRARGAPRP